MKKAFIAAAVICSISGTAYAADNGFYAGVQAGYGNLGYSSSNVLDASDVMDATNQELINDNNMDNPVDIWGSTLTPTSTSASSFSSGNGISGRLFLGYQFNPYFALEAGYLYMPQKATSEATYNGAGQVTQAFNVFNPFEPTTTSTSPATAAVTVKRELSENAADINAKFIWPIEDTGFNPYIKLGAVFIDTHSSTTVEHVAVNIQGIDHSQVNVNPHNIQNSIKEAESALAPEGSLGVDYDINNHLSADLSWTMILGNNHVQNINFVGAGLIYHFA